MAEMRTHRCPAKVNLALSVGSPHSDGLHPICSWMARVSLFDDLTVRRLGEREPSEFDIDWAADAPRPGPIDWPVEEDLTCLAAQLTEHYTARPLPVAVTLRKRIPAAAGLGGGSSDAAAMLRALDELFGLGLSADDLGQIAERLGSDVAFFLGEGEPSAIVAGRGERIEPAPLARPLDLVLILPELRCPTGAVYRKFDEMIAEPALNRAAVRMLAERGRRGDLEGRGDRPLGSLDEQLFNDLAGPACRVEPKLAALRDRLADLLGRPIHLTGSGAALFVLAGDPKRARRIAEAVSAGEGVAAVAVRTL